MNPSVVLPREFGRRFRKALSIPFLINQVCSSNVKDFVTSYATTLGCTEKCFFFPLLTCTAACLGIDTNIELTENWKEPPIIWTLVITPVSLYRIDVAEHMKQLFFEVQNEMWSVDEDTKDHFKKFMFDCFDLEQLQENLRFSRGHGLSIYNNIRALHSVMMTPKEADVMSRLHAGCSWFQDSRVSKNTLTKTRVNFCVVSTPTTVQQTLNTAPNFQELMHQRFLTTCGEVNHVKFSQISNPTLIPKLKKIFVSLMKLHFGTTKITYTLSAEAKEKFEQIHDELTDKAKQMSRKNAHKVFHPALSYLARLSCVLHVLDNAIDSFDWNVSLDPLTWNTVISADAVWQARELLGHVVEQRHMLMEQTIINPPQQRSPQPPEISIEDPPSGSQSFQFTPQLRRSSRNMTPPVSSTTPSNSFHQVDKARRNLTTTSADAAFDALLNQPKEPRVVSVHSVSNPAELDFNPIISSCQTVNANGINAEINFPPSLSVKIAGTSEKPLSTQGTKKNLAEMSHQEFVSLHQDSIRRLLKHNVSQISPSHCLILKLTPNLSSDQKYSASFTRAFLKKLESLGFGVCDGPNKANSRHFLFKKKKFSVLTDEQRKMLGDLKVTEKDYNNCFSIAAKKKALQNGGIVCLD